MKKIWNVSDKTKKQILESCDKNGYYINLKSKYIILKTSDDISKIFKERKISLNNELGSKHTQSFIKKLCNESFSTIHYYVVFSLSSKRFKGYFPEFNELIKSLTFGYKKPKSKKENDDEYYSNWKNQFHCPSGVPRVGYLKWKSKRK